MRAIYSPLFASQDGGRVADQLPYFCVAQRLEAENLHYSQQHEDFRRAFDEQRDALGALRGQLRVRPDAKSADMV